MPVLRPPCPYKCGSKNCREKGKPPLNLKDKLVIWVLGAPGSGKEAQCMKIAQKYGLFHIPVENLEKIDKLAINDELLQTIKETIANESADTAGFVLDGYPRHLTEAVAFTNSISPVDAILFFYVPDPCLIRRLLQNALESGNVEENRTAIRRRLTVFNENNGAILKKFADKVIEINAEKNEYRLFNDVISHMDRLIQTKGRSSDTED